tara:strand:- start:427 stop:678 length:252 start_codon:yes stop_codon:yes gene_type:complete
MIAKDGLNAKIAENRPMQYREAKHGDLVSRTFDKVVGIFKYNIREYGGNMTVAYWAGEGLKSISTNSLMVWCEEDNKWKWIKT